MALFMLLMLAVLALQHRDGFDLIDLEEDIPTQEMIERMEEKLEQSQGEQKSLFLIIFQVG